MSTWHYYAVIFVDDDGSYTVECIARLNGDLNAMRDYYRDECGYQNVRIVPCTIPISMDDIDVIVDE